MPDKAQTQFCHYEKARFPLDEFTNTEKFGWVHDREPRHTMLGALVDEQARDPKIQKKKIPGPMKRL